MEQFLTYTIIGLSVAAIYAVAASGLVLTYTTTGIFNFAHGAIGMIGAFAYWQLRFSWGWPAPLALVVVLVVLGPLFGAFLERVIWRGLQGASEAVRLVVSVSLLIALIGLANWVWAPGVARPFPRFFEGTRFTVGDFVVTAHEASVLVIGLAVAVGLRFVLYGTRAGIAMRATVDDRSLASLNGARPDRTAMLAWALGCSLAALAGILIAPITTLVDPALLSLLIVNAYAAAMIGRLRSLPLTFLGAMVIGLAESYWFGFAPASDLTRNFRFAIPAIILFVVLLVLRQERLRGHAPSRRREFFPMPSLRLAVAGAAGTVAVAVAISMIATDPARLDVARMFAYGIIALSLVPLIGYAGQISLAQLSLAGIGAVVMAYHGSGGNIMGLVYATVITAAVGAVIALPALRLSGLYLALATAAFAVALDRWVFRMRELEIFGVELRFFEQGSIRVSRLDVAGISFASPQAQLVLLSVVFCLLALGVVALRRSSFGQRLVAMKDSEAACATLGMNLTGTKLAVFALSAGIAGLGGALYAGLLVAVDSAAFNLVAGLPVFMLAVVGGIGTVSGALFAGIALAGLVKLGPIVSGWSSALDWVESFMLVAPGLIGITLGRNPSGVMRDIGERFAPVARHGPVLGGLVVALAGIWMLALVDVIDNWTWFALSIVAVIVAGRGAEAAGGGETGEAGEAREAIPATVAPEPAPPAEASRVPAGDVPLELVGVDRPFESGDRVRIDAALGIREGWDRAAP